METGEVVARELDRALWEDVARRVVWPNRRVGTVVSGIDLERPTDEMFARLVEAFLTHSVVVVKCQKLSPQKQVELTSRFGPLKVTLHGEFAKKDLPPLMFISNVVENGKPIGFMANENGWHTDGSTFEQPSGITMLHAIEIPPSGGDTLFADMHAAYEALPPEKKREFDAMKIHHQYVFRYKDSSQETAKKRAPEAIHPLVRTQPFTGRRALYTGEKESACALGMPPDDGRRFMRDLIDYATQPQFVFAHKWDEGDVVIWDNRMILHRATDFDMANHRRLLHRCGTISERPYFAP